MPSFPLAFARTYHGSGEPIPEMMTLRQTTFAAMGHGREIRRLFDAMEHVQFFVKDAQGAFMAANRALVRLLGFESEVEVIGLTDFDLHPPHIAKQLRQDDWNVMFHRKPLVDHVEAIFNDPERLEWHCTTKLPLMDVNDEVIGIMGVTRPCAPPEPVEGSLPAPLRQVVEEVRRHYAHPLRVAELAASASISPRRLNELFQASYRMSAQQFMLRTRVQAAMEDLLRTHKTLAQIAHDNGFVDQSAFTRHFRALTGMTPRTFQQRQRLLPEAWQKVPLILPKH
jgi:PAS domain S-box-containing protein